MALFPAKPHSRFYMVHHESIEAKMASEQGGVGWFDVLEERPGTFQVYDGGSGATSDYETLASAKTGAQQLADEFDQRKVDELKLSWKADPCWDIEDTAGFEWCRQELYIFRLETEVASLQAALKDMRTGLVAFGRLIAGFLPTGRP